MPPVRLEELVPPNPRFDWLTFRVTNKVLLAPVFGAFSQAAFTHRVPVLAAAALTRVRSSSRRGTMGPTIRIRD